jgi:hypothetical protein
MEIFILRKDQHMAWSKATRAKFKKTMAERKKHKNQLVRTVTPHSILKGRIENMDQKEMMKLQLAHEIVTLLNKVL